ncbi:M60 family metallopeptidase [Streptomyces sp. VRA16 Mangrove soil]|uniref:M60 family metallopeptidase n=1 Tax=Streptomyces sp. VRA16 Mangrove soil TaxID=2817434 RepID=UPI001A9CD79C|nr:M60 family metallopeptidase [Streptomyces sp. VRA16 Mangrove soil]MBO1329732.1 M60 family metallopeptidase [Streptomyces sp. VRA16 Mangrove soil]
MRTPASLPRRSVLGAAAAGAVLIAGAGAGTARAAGACSVTLTARPSAESERLRLAQALRASEFQPTGRYVPAATELRIEVLPFDDVLPTLWIGQWDYYGTLKEPRSYALKAGTNRITDPYGGPVYFSLEGAGERAGVTFRSGSVPMPVFRLGQTEEAAFQRQLDAYPDVPVVELVGPRSIVTLTRDGALLYRDEDHAALLRLLEQIIEAESRISGLDSSKPVHRPKAGGYHFTEVSVVPSGVGAYATHGYNGFPRAYLDRATTVSGLSTRGWGLYHELGHLHQQMAYKPTGLTEVTVNIYSLAVQRALGQTSNLLTVDPKTGLNYFQSARTKFGTDGLTYEKSFGAYEKLVPLRQLELAFDDFWPRMHRLVREENPQSDYTETAKRYRALATYASRVAGHDLTDFFVNTWAFPIDAEGRAEIAALDLPQPPVDPSALTD